MKKTRKAFTLIEMVIVLFIISLLLLIMIPNLVQQKDNASKRSEEAFKTTLVTQAGLYMENHPEKSNTDKDKEVVTIKDLKDGNYITDAQVNKAKRIIGETDNILEESAKLGKHEIVTPKS
ncbi:prepilin-type N-terminal cleavage/methylation domain-containing protein [Companilactobacillus huachuanensis]|uniref:Prepilin-type N-terminal cleavage/methylation domain-containing protein n=1 Tax=Companilactobacillus huachuanensis TaxID=2559914 RepID=A0ABW1RLI4_9LACO|nr:prepilin-type N-terminal cleavage/methylation domain-containing protein [Companilactobacillus huachuanensis]